MVLAQSGPDLIRRSGAGRHPLPPIGNRRKAQRLPVIIGVVRIISVVLLITSLVACNRGTQSNDAVRQGILDHLGQAKSGLNLPGMDVKVTSVQYKGEEADASVSITAKGGDPAAGMLMNYHLRQQGDKWVVVGRQDGGASPHGALAAPDAANPHGGSPPNPHADGSGGSKMPSPEDLPPAGKK
jgi:hypothetical protein